MGKEYVQLHEVISIVPSPADVVLAEDFQETFNWTPAGNAGYIARKDPAAAFLKDYGAYLKTKTTIPGVGNTVYIQKYSGRVRARKLELFIHFIPEPGGVTGNQDFFITLSEGLAKYTFGVRRVGATGLLQYYKPGPAWAAITAITYPLCPSAWSLIKLTLDTVSKEYISIETGAAFADLKTILPYSYNSVPDSSCVIVEARTTADTAAATDMSISEIFVRAIPAP